MPSHLIQSLRSPKRLLRRLFLRMHLLKLRSSDVYSSPTTLAPPVTIIIPDHVPALDITTYAPESSTISPPWKVSSSFDANPLGVPYSLPSGIIVTENTVSRREEPTTSLLLKNYMLRKEMEGIMGYSSPTELHDAFSHFQLKVFSS
ncbi:hypothetical protein LIER_41578 [Lithospermum erythrorhizon]|uniref:Uncharacterized protein n=1 Tax=Lithospermum erythrorhizon TaxID=34254 RepID=A0AAV3RD31_LITER